MIPYTWLLNPVIQWNISTRIFEFAFGMFLCMYVFGNRKYLLILSILCASFVIVFNIVMKNNVDSMSFLGLLSCISLTVLVLQFTKLLLVLFYYFGFPMGNIEGLFKNLTKYSFMAFIYHHQVIVLILAKLNYETSLARTMFLTASTLVFSYFLAYLTYKPATILKDIVFFSVTNFRKGNPVKH